jgi:hypothetical protein
LSVVGGAHFFGEIVLKNWRQTWPKIALVLSLFFAAAVCKEEMARANISYFASLQEAIPSPPSDRTLIYLADGKGALSPIAYETGTTPLKIETAAKGDKRSYVELKGERSPTVITNMEPRFYLFLPDTKEAKPPFIVRLSEKGGRRRVVAMAQKGYKGFAIDSEEIIKPHYRVLGREGGMIFMEIRTRDSLMLGEYAIIGADLKQIATFRVAAS